ncbi:NAD-dependent epimerase/dehydratase family protein [Streptomyces sp. AC555_RSS877]|uniref:NAD-dependent epimerase/dehydratase family protein n=1 Tax=Streptomyces sp. AC555_RSS877 TaxID=2823688 RepID=UPI001C268326|nr:NAD-dependent epimerase/dehydratase family protein [Streptomyces sp. AC555_RSS877]
MNLLVTGAAGFIEPAHVRMPRADEASDAPRTTALDRLARAGALGPPELGLPRPEFVRGDIHEAGPFDEPTADVDPVVPSATQSHTDHSIASANDFVLRWDTRGAYRDRVDRSKVRTAPGHRGWQPLKRHAQGLS